jgi:hypothetical protein
MEHNDLRRTCKLHPSTLLEEKTQKGYREIRRFWPDARLWRCDIMARQAIFLQFELCGDGKRAKIDR